MREPTAEFWAWYDYGSTDYKSHQFDGLGHRLLITCLPDPVSPIAAFCAELIRRLDGYAPSVTLESEKDVEKHLLEPVIDNMEKLDTMKIYRHPWEKRGLALAWREVKRTHCAEVYGTRHTADMYLCADGTRGISVDVKLANIISGRMPNGALQTLIGQCVLASTRHDFAIGLFAHYGNLHQKKWGRDSEDFDSLLARMGIYVVRKYLGPASEVRTLAPNT